MNATETENKKSRQEYSARFPQRRPRNAEFSIENSVKFGFRICDRSCCGRVIREERGLLPSYPNGRAVQSQGSAQSTKCLFGK